MISTMNMIVLFFLFIIIRVDITMAMIPFEARIGQGLLSTRWNGLNFINILFDFCCVKGDQGHENVCLNTSYC